jgi:hypothetical protein
MQCMVTARQGTMAQKGESPLHLECHLVLMADAATLPSHVSFCVQGRRQQLSGRCRLLDPNRRLWLPRPALRRDLEA